MIVQIRETTQIPERCQVRRRRHVDDLSHRHIG